MSALATALVTGLIYGAVLSVLMSGLFLYGARMSPDAMLRGYPPDIKAKYGAPSERGRGVQRGMAMLLLPILLGTLAAGLLRLADLLGADFGFLPATACVFVMLAVFNLIDLLVLDWLIFVTLQPRFVVLPGTEGLAGYADYGFHLRAFVRGILLALIISPVIGGIAAAVFAVTG